MTKPSIFADAMATESITMDNGIVDSHDAPHAAEHAIINNLRHLHCKYGAHYGEILEEFSSGLVRVEILLKDEGLYGDTIIAPEDYRIEKVRRDADPENYVLG